MSDLEEYEKAMSEIETSQINPGLWAKCLVECNGNESSAKAHYIKIRAEQMLEIKSKIARDHSVNKFKNLISRTWLPFVVGGVGLFLLVAAIRWVYIIREDWMWQMDERGLFQTVIIIVMFGLSGVLFYWAERIWKTNNNSK